MANRGMISGYIKSDIKRRKNFEREISERWIFENTNRNTAECRGVLVISGYIKDDIISRKNLRAEILRERGGGGERCGNKRR